MEIEEQNQENLPPEPITVVEVPNLIPIQDVPNKTKILSLVPDYNSDSSLSEIENVYVNDNVTATNCAAETATVLANKFTRSSSSSSSTSSSSSSSSSSDCNSSTPTFQNVGTQPEEKTSCPNPPKYSERQRGNDNTTNYNISPLYTDQSDVDLSDDDPTVDFNTIFHRQSKRKNFLFEESNSYSSDSDCNTKSTNRGRKRLRNVEKWQQVKSERLRNKGEAYVSMSKSRKTVPARFIKDTCTEICKLKCGENVNPESRYKLFSDFWDLGNLSAQRAYIRTCIEDVVPKYKYTNSEHPRRPIKLFISR